MKKQTQTTGRPRIAYALATWCAIMAGAFALAAGQTGCSTIAGGFTGAVHGLADDLDGLTDKMSKDKAQRESNRYE